MVKIAQDLTGIRAPTSLVAPAIATELEPTLPSRHIIREPQVMGINVFNEIVSAPGATNTLYVQLRYPNGAIGTPQDLIVSNHVLTNNKVPHRPGQSGHVVSVLTLANCRKKGTSFVPENFKIYYARFERRTNPLMLTELVQDPDILPTDNKMEAALIHYAALHKLMRRIDLNPSRKEFSQMYGGAFFEDDDNTNSGNNADDNGDGDKDSDFSMSLGKNGDIFAKATPAVKKAGGWKEAESSSDYQAYMIAFGHNKCREPFEDLMVVYTRNIKLARLIRTYVGMILFETKCRETVRERTFDILAGIGVGHALN